VSADRGSYVQAALAVSADPVVPRPRERVTHAVHLRLGAAVLGAAGAIDEGTADAIDDAVGSCLPGETDREGATVRFLAEEGAQGSPRLVALEYRATGAPPVRYYGFPGRDGSGYFDETGLRACSLGWQSPLAHLRRTSRFDPQRMHPILHRRMPHEGTDFGAPKGTPVYASYRGVVDWAGPHGSHGNWVAVVHPDGIETGYAHLSKIVPGLKRGDRVRAHQLVGWVGSTGRSTGPHLHFSARKDGVYFDGETLLARADHSVPGVDRAAFLTAKAEADRQLDAIALPAEAPAPAAK
jgi:murein DD-endopeptidase MepM/ murein hydrolase activator NlpD